jgi:NADPH-dependent curcumin reductase CurA
MPTPPPREIQLRARPVGWPTHDDFALVESAVPDLQDGQVRVRNTVMSVDPYMRGRMSDAKSYADPYALGEAMTGGAVGVVEESRAEGIAVGDHVLHGLGWREVAVVDAASARVVDPDVAPDSAYLGVLGMTGLTAYAGLTRIAQLTPGDIVFVSGAAGAVGSVAGQIAHAMGASQVIGSAGSPAKVRHVIDDLGFDAAFDLKYGRLRRMIG